MCSLGCPEHLKEMDIMQNATPPTKRPLLPRLDIPGAPSGIHVPASTAQNVRDYPMLLSPAAPFCVATFGQTLVNQLCSECGIQSSHLSGLCIALEWQHERP